MRLSISGIGLDKKRKIVTWDDGNIEAEEFLKSLYGALGKNL